MKAYIKAYYSIIHQDFFLENVQILVMLHRFSHLQIHAHFLAVNCCLSHNIDLNKIKT